MTDNADGPGPLTRRSVLTRVLLGAGSYYVTAGTHARTVEARVQNALPLQSEIQGTAQPVARIEALQATGEQDAAAEQSGAVLFPNGVASGDPQPDGVVLWTRAVPSDGTGGPVSLTAEMALDPAFQTLVVSKDLTATAASDHTVRLFVDGLDPATVYYYRFRSGTAVSQPLGRTVTAPDQDDPRPVVLATVSCQNYQSNVFVCFRHMIADDDAKAPEDRIQAVVHLGDFIYETIHGAENRNADTRQTGRRTLGAFPSGGKRRGGGVSAQSLDDYRHLYKTYLSDPDLIAARARWPFICTWDDHEFANDSWQSHNTSGREGKPAQTLKVAANQAWFEFIPALLTGARGVNGVEPAAADFEPVEVVDAPMDAVDGENRSLEPNNLAAIGSMTIYRSLRFGRHVDLIVSDTRSYRSDHAIPEPVARRNLGGATRAGLPVDIIELADAGRTANDGNPPETLTYRGRRFPNPRRDAPVGTILGPDQKRWWKATMKASDATWRVWATSVPVMPLHLDADNGLPGTGTLTTSADAWDGYPAERSELTRYLAEEGIANVVAISGDHHAAFAGVVAKKYGRANPRAVAVEFSTPAISSPTMKTYASRIADTWARLLTAYKPVASGKDEREVANLNTTLLWGVQSAMVMALTELRPLARLFRNRTQNAHLAHVDTDCHGYCRIRFGADGARANYIAIELEGPDGLEETGSERYRARFTLAPWQPGSAPKLKGPVFEGRAPFPF